jgi:hypothetical protein
VEKEQTWLQRCPLIANHFYVIVSSSNYPFNVIVVQIIIFIKAVSSSYKRTKDCESAEKEKQAIRVPASPGDPLLLIAVQANCENYFNVGGVNESDIAVEDKVIS